MTTQPSGANALDAIKAKIDAGETAWAIKQLRSLAESSNSSADVHRLLAFAYLKNRAPDAAAAQLERARTLGTTAATEIAFGRMLRGEDFMDAALNCFLDALEREPKDVDAMALASMTYANLGKTENADDFGQKCLDLCDDEARQQSVAPTPGERPTPFKPDEPNRNIIAFSLFGTNRYYWESAIAIASMAVTIFPEWRCRFYCDPDLPESVRDTLHRLRAQLYITAKPSQSWRGLFWRFLAFDDPDVDVVLVRDVDSPFSLRERLAVDEWLASDFPFHVIRDHRSHMEPMMAGLWGGWTKLLPPMQPLIEEYFSQIDDRYADQKFLRLNIWPRIRRVTMAHDRYYQLGETRRPPEHPTQDHTHIGGGWPRASE